MVSPFISSVLIPNKVIDEGFDICLSDEHPLKAKSPNIVANGSKKKYSIIYNSFYIYSFIYKINIFICYFINLFADYFGNILVLLINT